jgi:hypothetical protein
MDEHTQIKLTAATDELAAIAAGRFTGPHPGRRKTEMDAVVARLEGIPVYRGTERQVIPQGNAKDMVQHLGWSLMPTPEWREAQNQAG